MRLAGRVVLADIGIGLDVWWLDQYAGGLFLPVRDGTAGTTTYGGGRYLLDTAKGAPELPQPNSPVAKVSLENPSVN
jgi:hypothetical protein